MAIEDISELSPVSRLVAIATTRFPIAKLIPRTIDTWSEPPVISGTTKAQFASKKQQFELNNFLLVPVPL